jgi:dTDP-4-amino-4,6-dideoxygalactose transaminase
VNQTLAIDGGEPAVTDPFPRRPRYGDAECEAVISLLRSGRLSETGRGPAVTALENAFAAVARTRHALSFNSGTASLHAALHAVGARDDAGVAASPMTWISAIAAIFHTGSFPVFCDIERDSPNLSRGAVAALGSSISAVLVTHTWGIPAHVDAIAEASGAPIVEDCSHTHGATYRGRPVGSWGAAGCFSLQESKAVSGGEGGILTTSDRLVYERALTVGHHPHRLATELTLPETLPFVDAGASWKYRMPAVSAAIVHEQLRSLPERRMASEVNFTLLREALSGLPITWPRLDDDSVRGWYGMPLIFTEPVTNPAGLHQACRAEGIPLRALYDDWLTAPILQRRELIARFWPSARRYQPPEPDAFPNYRRARRQMVILKVPDHPAPDYRRRSRQPWRRSSSTGRDERRPDVITVVGPPVHE